MTGEERDGREGEVENGRDQRVEPIGICIRVCVCLVEFQTLPPISQQRSVGRLCSAYRTPKFRITPSCDYRSLYVRTQFFLDVSECSNDFLCEALVEAVFRRLLHRYDEDWAMSVD